MTLFALSESWNELYAAGGFWIGLLGFLVGVLGFIYTIWQVKKTQSAARAAREAAEAALAESRRNFLRFLTVAANRTLGELRLLVEYESWGPAAFRADDLSESLAQMLAGVPDELSLVTRLRDTAAVFRRKAKGEAAAFAKNQWAELLKLLHAFLDRAKNPFDATGGSP